MLEKIWNDIRLIYDWYNLKSKLVINDLMIISKDNYYLVYHRPHRGETTQFRIEKNYNLVNIWSDSKEVDITDYNLHVEVDSKIEIDEDYKIKLVYNIMTPYLREVKLKSVGI